MIEPHRHEGVFIARGKEDALVTLNMVPGEGVYGEKRVSVEEQDKGEFFSLFFSSKQCKKTEILCIFSRKIYSHIL